MSFFGLIGVPHPYCTICDTLIHRDYLPTDFDLLEEKDFPVLSTEYKCIKCSTEMAIESVGNDLFNTYPDEDTFPEEDVFPDENVLF
jgi:hypothetical protein